jgi:ATP adenylyltransferase
MKRSLKKYLLTEMSMSHIYQPVMVRTLLENSGNADKSLIAKNISSYDISQQEYYQSIVDKMVGRVLRNNGIVEKNNSKYSLLGFDDLTKNDIAELIAICDQKLADFIEKRGDKIFLHRSKNRKPVPGSIRYEVLKRAKGRCELCGVSNEEKALEVDHIVPKNKGGKDYIDNYQALCYSCNSNKRDLDDTDFRNLNAQYQNRERNCVFCSVDQNEVVFESEMAIAFKDRFPVTQGHLLIIPRRHCSNYFELSQPEINAIIAISHKYRNQIQTADPSITAFNIGFNSGTDAGQTIFHAHMHMIPRRESDIDNPAGGIRNVIPGKGKY